MLQSKGASAVLYIKPELMSQMVAQARAGAPLETCGILGGRQGQALAAYPMANELHSPVRYRADPQELLSAFLDIESRGWEIVGIYHSHPAGPAVPSATDIAEAYYPEAVYIIISLAQQPPSVRGFKIIDGQVGQASIVVLPQEHEGAKDLNVSLVAKR